MSTKLDRMRIELKEIEQHLLNLVIIADDDSAAAAYKKAATLIGNLKLHNGLSRSIFGNRMAELRKAFQRDNHKTPQAVRVYQYAEGLISDLIAEFKSKVAKPSKN